MGDDTKVSVIGVVQGNRSFIDPSSSESPIGYSDPEGPRGWSDPEGPIGYTSPDSPRGYTTPGSPIGFSSAEAGGFSGGISEGKISGAVSEGLYSKAYLVQGLEGRGSMDLSRSPELGSGNRGSGIFKLSLGGGGLPTVSKISSYDTSKMQVSEIPTTTLPVSATRSLRIISPSSSEGTKLIDLPIDEQVKILEVEMKNRYGPDWKKTLGFTGSRETKLQSIYSFDPSLGELVIPRFWRR